MTRLKEKADTQARRVKSREKAEPMAQDVSDIEFPL
jgi:hypothetical protein